MATPQSGSFVSPEEYLRREREAEERHEYDNGRIYAMSGGSLSQSRIRINLARETSAGLKGKSCESLSPKMKVCINAAGKFYYPDLSIVCGEPRFHDRERDALLNPAVIVDVISPSSEKRDRTTKFFAYQQIESLTDYLLTSQDRPLVEHFARQPKGQWLYTAYKDLSDVISLSSIDCRLPLAGVYDRVECPPEEEFQSDTPRREDETFEEE